MDVEAAGLMFLDPTAHQDGRYDEACRILRRESPIHWVSAEGVRPYWALTRHADIMEVERRNDVFVQRQGAWSRALFGFRIGYAGR